MRLAAIVRALHALNHRVPAALACKRVDDVVHRAISTLTVEHVLEDAAIEVILAAGDARVWIDEIQIQLVLSNLVCNAIQAMAGQTDKTVKVVVATSVSESHVTVSVADHGIGVPIELRERIFAPFVTTKKDGTGIGLAICKSILEAHGGTMDFVSCEDQGTTFSFSLILAASSH